MSTPTLRWLQIHQYEQFEPVRIEFSPKENLILGLNGAGKTQLLKLIRAVLCLDFGELLRKSFEVEFELETRGSGENAPAVEILGRVSNKIELPPFRTSEELLSDAAGPADTLSARIKFSGAGEAFSIDLRGDTIHYEAEDGAFSEDFSYRDQGELKPRRLVTAQGTNPKRMLGLLFPVCEACFVGESDRQFEELTTALEFTLGRYVDPSSLASPTTNGAGRMWRQDVLRLVLWAWSSRRGGWPQAEELGINRALLDAWRRPLGAQWIRFRPNVVREAERDGEKEYGCRGIEFVVRFQGGPQVAHSELTFGQRRYIYAGLVSLPRPGVPVVCDEIDNGMHPRLVLALLEMWSDRQVFVATHNQLVIDSTNFYSPADVREKIHIVRRRDDGRQVVKVFDEETAREIHAAIDVKIQSPSAVLETEGLW